MGRSIALAQLSDGTCYRGILKRFSDTWSTGAVQPKAAISVFIIRNLLTGKALSLSEDFGRFDVQLMIWKFGQRSGFRNYQVNSITGARIFVLATRSAGPFRLSDHL